MGPVQQGQVFSNASFLAMTHRLLERMLNLRCGGPPLPLNVLPANILQILDEHCIQLLPLKPGHM